MDNKALRARTKELVSGNFWRLLGLTLLYALVMLALSLVVSMVLTLVAGSSLQNPSASARSATLYLLSMLISAVIILPVSCGLSLGFYAALLNLVRTGSFAVKDLFSRFSQCFKGVGVSLLVAWKTFLWALLAYVPMILLLALGLAGSQGQLTEGSAALITIAPLLMLVLVCALVVPAVLRYSQSYLILTDRPDSGVFQCVRESKAMMQNNKWRFFKLPIPYALLIFLIAFGFSLAAGVVLGLIGSTSAVLVQLVSIAALLITLPIYIRAMVAPVVFYDALTTPAAPQEQAIEV